MTDLQPAGEAGHTSEQAVTSLQVNAAAYRYEPLADVERKNDWQELNSGERTETRRCGWMLVPLRPALRVGWFHALSMRWHLQRTEELAYLAVHTQQGTRWPEVRTIGAPPFHCGGSSWN